MSTSTQLMTAEELLLLPSGQYRYELINGELKTMSPAGHDHGRISVRLTAPLAQFVWDNNLGEVFSSDTGFQLTSDPDTVLAADVSFVTKERVLKVGRSRGYWQGPPDLAVEVLSPSEGRAYLAKRVSQWLSFGVRQLWIVDPKTSTVSIYKPGDVTVTLAANEFLDGGDLLPGFSLAVKRVFEL
jgi:Uma2 family endonuclease